VTALTMTPADPVPVSHDLSYDGSLDVNGMLVDGSDHADPGQLIGNITPTSDATMPTYLAFPPPPAGATSCTTAPCAHGVVMPVDSTSLRPTASAFAFGSTVRLNTQASATAGMNLIQRGIAVKFEPQWKAQLDYGYASCRWSDGFHTLVVGGRDSGQLPLRIGSWYAINCAQLSPTTFTETVTDLAAGADVVTATVTTPYAMGGIAPAGPVTIGSKTLTAGLDRKVDQFHGDMTDIFVRDGSPAPITG
jgi:hypothetical protein